MANWNTPNNSEPAHENVLKALADKDTYSLTMGQAGGVWTNQPVGAMLWNNSAAYFQRWNGSNAIPVVISVAGGGTGASTAAQARANLGANDAGNLTAGTVPAERLTGTYNINISGNAATATSAGSATNAANVPWSGVASKPATATRWPSYTEVTGKPTVSSSVTSSSTTQLANSAAVKAAYDKASSATSDLSSSLFGAVSFQTNGSIVFKSGAITSVTRLSVGRYKVEFVAIPVGRFLTFTATCASPYFTNRVSFSNNEIVIDVWSLAGSGTRTDSDLLVTLFTHKIA